MYNKQEITSKSDRVLTKVPVNHYLKKLRKSGKNLSQVSLCPCRESKQLFLGYKSELYEMNYLAH